MIGYIVRRVLAIIPVLLVVGIVVFMLIHLTPGDPAQVILGDAATPARVKVLRHQLGLDQPLWKQFLTWVEHVCRGNLGTSLFYQQSVVHTVAVRVGPTASLAGLAFVFSLVIAIPSALLAVWKRGSLLDPIFMSGSLLGVSMPNFWLALMMISLFGVKLGWLPVSGYVPLDQGVGLWFSHLLMPAFVLAIQQAGLIARMLRDGMLDVLHQDYIRTARAKGAGERLVLLHHAFRNALIPTVTVIGTSLAGLLGGAVVTEVVFAIPGVGNLIVQSIASRDFPVLTGAVMFVALVYVLVNLLIDLLYSVLDPRVQYR
ncbi:MAG: peptide transporter [Marmoricola sp.]|nr:peptide transporter [Marmoricola sp.]